MAFTSPVIPASGITFAQMLGSGASGHLDRLIALMMSPTAAPTAAPTLSATAGGYGSAVAAVGVTLYVKITETNGIGETTASPEAGPITVALAAAPPVAPTGAGSGTGGSLAAGTYTFRYSYVDALGGETPAGTEASATITSGQVLTVTFNDTLPAGCTRRLYLTAGGSGTETLYASGVTAATYVCSSASWTNGTTTFGAAAGYLTTGTSVAMPLVTFAAMQTGNLARNVYVGTATGAEVCYARGVTSGTLALVAAIPTNSYAVAPPTANSTGLTTTTASGAVTNQRLVNLRSCKSGKLQSVWDRFAEHYRRFAAGEPIPHAAAIEDVRHAQVVFGTLYQAATELGTLIEANPGHLVPTSNTMGVSRLKRQWP